MVDGKKPKGIGSYSVQDVSEEVVHSARRARAAFNSSANISKQSASETPGRASTRPANTQGERSKTQKGPVVEERAASRPPAERASAGPRRAESQPRMARRVHTTLQGIGQQSNAPLHQRVTAAPSETSMPPEERVTEPGALSAKTARPGRRSRQPVAVDVVRGLKTPVPLSARVMALRDSAAPSVLDEKATEAIERVVSLGHDALPVMGQHFPGQLWFERDHPYSEPPTGRAVSGLASAFVEFGDASTDELVRLLRSDDVEQRFCAVPVAAEIGGSVLLEEVYQRLFDEDPQVRAAALGSLITFRKTAGFAKILGSLRLLAGEGATGAQTRVTVVDALGRCRDTKAVHILHGLLSCPDKTIIDVAHRALVAVTAQDFSTEMSAWREWLDRHASGDRAAWLVAALSHRASDIRRFAVGELEHFYGVSGYGYEVTADATLRGAAVDKYNAWLKTRLAGPTTDT